MWAGHFIIQLPPPGMLWIARIVDLHFCIAITHFIQFQRSSYSQSKTKHATWVILGMGKANERRRYNVTSSLIGWTHIQSDLYTTLRLTSEDFIPGISRYRWDPVIDHIVLGRSPDGVLYDNLETRKSISHLSNMPPTIMNDACTRITAKMFNLGICMGSFDGLKHCEVVRQQQVQWRPSLHAIFVRGTWTFK